MYMYMSHVLTPQTTMISLYLSYLKYLRHTEQIGAGFDIFNRLVKLDTPHYFGYAVTAVDNNLTGSDFNMAIVDEGLQIVMVDSDKREQNTDFRIDAGEIVLPTGYQASVDALYALTNGTTVAKPFMGALKKVRFYVDVEPTGAVLFSTHGDIRDKWELKFANGDRHTLGGRNTIAAMTTTISQGELADTALASVTDLFDVLFGIFAANGLAIVDSDGASPTVDGMRAVSRARKRPRA